MKLLITAVEGTKMNDRYSKDKGGCLSDVKGYITSNITLMRLSNDR